MTKFKLLILFILATSSVFAQNYNTLFQQYLATTNGEILTIVNENNIQFDGNKNIYTMVDKEAIRFSILSKVSNTGNLMWVDTLKLPNYVASAIANFELKNNKIYTFATYGNNLNSSIAEACAIQVYDLNGGYVNQKIIANASTNYFAKNIQVQKNGNLIIEYITNTANQNWTLHVDCVDSNLNPKWNQTFAWPSYSPTAIASTLDNNSNTYISYTIDSTDAGNYYRKAFIQKIDSAGVLKWTTIKYGKRYNLLKIDNAGNLISAGENIAPLVYVTNNAGDVFISKINASNGSIIWDSVYNNVSNEKELVYSLAVDASNNILIGGNENIQDLVAVHNNGYARLYNTNGTLISSITKPAFEIVFRTDFLPNGNLIVRSSTASNLYINEYNFTPTVQSTKIINFVNGVGWTAMDISPTNDLAIAVSDVTCANRGVNILYLSKNPLAINTVEENKFIDIYPNPTQRVVNCKFGDEISKIEVYTIFGQLINETTLNKNTTSFTIDCLSYVAGVYFIKAIHSNQQISVAKFIKE